MGDSQDKALHLVGMIYDAALDEQKWPLFLESFASAMGGKSAILRSTNYEASQARFAASFGYDPAMKAAYSNYYVNLDCFAPFFKTAPLNTARPGECTRYGMIPRKKYLKTEFYNDYMRPWGGEYVMGSVLARDGNHMLQFAAQRGKRTGAFGEEQVRLMNTLSPHVNRAVQVHRKISDVTVEKEWALGALDQLRMGVILTDRLGAPLFANRAAEEFLSSGQGIATRQGRLALSRAGETAQFHQFILDAAQGAPGASRGGDMRIPLPDGESLHCLVMPIPLELSARLDVKLASGCVAIFLSQPGGLQLPVERLAGLYRLTPAEARLAGKLAALKSVEQAADELCITVGTARCQLKSIFAKTGAKGQPELLMLLATSTLANCREE